jgi:hypothetical protein
LRFLKLAEREFGAPSAQHRSAEHRLGLSAAVLENRLARRPALQIIQRFYSALRLTPLPAAFIFFPLFFNFRN